MSANAIRRVTSGETCKRAGPATHPRNYYLRQEYPWFVDTVTLLVVTVLFAPLTVLAGYFVRYTPFSSVPVAS